MKKLSAANPKKMKEPTWKNWRLQNFHRFLYGRLGDENTAWFFHFCNGLRICHFTLKWWKKRKFKRPWAPSNLVDLQFQSVRAMGIIEREILRGNHQFFIDIADMLKKWSRDDLSFGSADDPEDVQLRELERSCDVLLKPVSAQYLAAWEFLKKRHPDSFTRDELTDWIENKTGNRPSKSTITDILKRCGIKARDRRVTGKWGVDSDRLPESTKTG